MMDRWLGIRGKLLRQLRKVLEQDGWEEDVGGYACLRYRKGRVSYKPWNKGGVAISCMITPYRGGPGPAITGYWVTFRIPLKHHPKSGERAKLRRFRTAYSDSIKEARVLSKIKDLFRSDN